ncbi:hypothetical protein Lferr_2549 [Acidithiobacillus ferrooxidans ATCC 53993]|jgi:hypothetical protein|nr:hypothetical protein Lferr_2549 [Acidithiobacillus ferrooxidans ATCC 53993]
MSQPMGTHVPQTGVIESLNNALVSFFHFFAASMRFLLCYCFY